MSQIDLASLLSPCTIPDFFENYWEKTHLHQSQGMHSIVNDILSIADLDVMLSNQNLSTSCLRIVKDGHDIPEEQWTRLDKLISGKTRNCIAPDKVFHLFGSGCTLILNAAERTIPSLGEACRTIEQELNILVQANIYITPPNSQGFHKHYDTHDIFTLQVKGPKTWKIYDTKEELPISFNKFKEEPVLVSQFEMNTGDFLYIPRGTVHEAFGSTDSTIAVNFSCKPRYGFHLLEELAKLAEDEEVFFRKIVPHAQKAESRLILLLLKKT